MSTSDSPNLRAPQSRGLNGKYLRPEDLRRLSHLYFSSRRIVEGQYSGHHSTPQRGQSVEFRDYRQYIPGDEIGSIDWKVYGRSDKLFIKLYEHQADLTVNVLVDASASMAYRGIIGRSRRRPLRRTSSDKAPASKYDYACSLAAAVAFLLIKQNDRVSFSTAQNGLADFLPSAGTMQHLLGILNKMEQTKPKGEADLSAAIREVVGKSRRRDLLIVVSDFLDDRDEIVKSLLTSVQRGGEVILFHVLHADELNLPNVERGLFIDSESNAKLRLNIEDIRSAYAVKLKEFLDGWSKIVRANEIDYTLCSTRDPYWQALKGYLTGRAARV